MITVAVIEDDARIRRTIQEVLTTAKDCSCVGAFADGTSAAEKLPALAPDVILMDINLPDISGVECTARIAPLLPQSEIVMLTVFQDPETIFQALAAGAHGYLVKPVRPSLLLESIREIREGGVPMSPIIARHVIDFFRRSAQMPPPPAIDRADLSLAPRELQVVEALVQGYSYKEIAARFSIATSTVGTYVRRIYDKLHVCSRHEIVAKYNQGGGAAPRQP